MIMNENDEKNIKENTKLNSSEKNPNEKNNENNIKTDLNSNPEIKLINKENDSRDSTEDLNSSNESKKNYSNNSNNDLNKSEEKTKISENHFEPNKIKDEKTNDEEKKNSEETQENITEEKKKKDLEIEKDVKDTHPEELKIEKIQPLNYNSGENDIKKKTSEHKDKNEKKIVSENLTYNPSNNNQIFGTNKNNNIIIDNDINLSIKNSELIGFSNLGNTCYMNSFLQILLHFPNFINQLKEIVKENNLKINLIDNIIKLSDNRTNKKYLRNIKYLMGEVYEKYGEYVQNDSQMFGIDLLNEMICLLKNEKNLNDSDEILMPKSKIKEKINFNNIEKYKKILFEEYKENCNFKEENEIFLEKLFQFHEYSIKVSAENVKNIVLEKVEYETFLNISLVIPQDKTRWKLVDLLKNKYQVLEMPNNEVNNKIETNFKNFNINEINIENNTNSNNNEKKNFFESIIEYIKAFFNYLFGKNSEEKNIIIKNKVSKKYRRLASLPKILILSINRAILGRNFNTDNISYEEYLDMSPFIDKEFLSNIKSTKYKLFAVNECYGYIRQSGHCYSYIKVNNKWFKFNDEYVHENIPKNPSNHVVGLYYIQC